MKESFALVLVAISGLTLGSRVALGQEQGASEAARLARVVEEIESLNALRSSLAQAFSGEPDQSTFAQVCKPVGAQAKALAEKHGWKIQQLALKYRNPQNRLDARAQRVYALMAEDPEIVGLWVRSELEGEKGLRYFRRISVERACLACHGPKEKRPGFIKDGYPDDRAYDFQEGDLRGVYSVFLAGG